MSPDPDYDLFNHQDLPRQMMPWTAVPGRGRWLADDTVLSDRIKERLSIRRNPRCGEGPRQIADLFPASQPGAPINQSRRFAAKLCATGPNVRAMEIPGQHHFSITQPLPDSTAPLTRAILDAVHQ
jgi:hypothetical protein